MKRMLTFFAVSLLLASCSKDDTDGGGPNGYPDPEPGTSYLLEGTVNTPGFTWTSHSVIGLYSTNSSVAASNKECKIVGWEDPNPTDGRGAEASGSRASQYDGKAVARFNTPPLDLVKGENKFLVYSPYNADLIYLAGVIYGLEVAKEQTQSAPNVAGSCFAVGTASGIAGVDEAFAFSMDPVTALAKIAVSTTDLAGYTLRKVSVWDKDNEATELAGAFNVNTNNMAFTTIETHNSAGITVAAPVALTSGTAQNLYLNLLPGDFSSKELWVVVELEKGVERVTIPLKKSGLVFTAGQTTDITISNLKLSDNAASDWYNPVETRYQSALGYAYGDANTYFIQCKNGYTYTGATYTPNSNYPGSVAIDIRARGNFTNVVDPRGATFEWAKIGEPDANGNGTGAVYTARTTQFSASAVDPTKFSIQYDGNTTVTVTNDGAYAGAPILLMIKDGKILWAWSFWNIAADGTVVTPVQIENYKLANMDIGQATTQYDQWIANTGTGTNPDPVFRTTHYYQWGRMMPIFWTSYWSIGYKSGANVPAYNGPLTTIAEAISKPVGLILNPTPEGDLLNWCDEKFGDLWGGNVKADPTATGVKSIYDPCPKGWRVADRKVYDYIVAQNPVENNGFTYSDAAGKVGIIFTGMTPANLFLTQGYGNGKSNAAGDRLATMGGGELGSAAQCSLGALWTNYAGSHAANQPYSFRYRSSNNKTELPMVSIFNRSISAAVRCQVDTENR